MDPRQPLVPAHHPRWLSEPFVGDTDIAEVFRCVARMRSLPSLLRVYVDGGVRKQHEELVLSRPPRSGETWQAWTARLFGDRPFGIVANGVERLPTGIPRKVAGAVRSWIDTFGLPAGGIDVALFIGNYGYTPFGVHRDTEHGVLIHLGPEEKDLLVWPPEAPELRGGRDFIDPEEIASSGQRFTLRAGDLFILPAQCYHVGRTRGLSASLTISLSDQTPRQLARKAMNQLLESGLQGVPKVDLPFGRVTGGPPNLRGLLRASGLASSPRRGRREWLERGVEDYRLALQSNGGLTLAPIVEPVNARALRGCWIQSGAPFPILWRQERSKIVLFVRRTMLSLAMHPALPDVMTVLNQGVRLEVSEVVELLSDRWSEEATLYLLKLLADAGGIEVTRERRRSL